MYVYHFSPPWNWQEGFAIFVIWRMCLTHLPPKKNVAAGEKALVCLYNGKSGKGLDSLRYQRYHEKVATNTLQVQPQTLLPTSAVALYHGCHVYFQVQQWKEGGQ